MERIAGNRRMYSSRSPGLWAMAILQTAVLAVAFLSRMSAQAPDVRHVLMLNSYHANYDWTEELIRSVRSTLRKNYDLEIWVEFMDTKRYSGADYFQQLARLYRFKYQQKRIDLILSTDDPALQFLLQYREELFGAVPVVFCGVNDVELAKRAPPQFYTGVIEVFDSRAILDLVLHLHPKASRIYIVTDNSPTSLSLYQDLILEKDRYKDREFILLDGRLLSLQEILDSLRSAPPGGVVITTSFTREKGGNYIPRERAHEILAGRSPFPVYGPSISNLGQGIIGGTENGGRYHGELAGKLAIRVLDGNRPASIPWEYDRLMRFVIDEQALLKWGLSPDVLPANCILLNHRPSFFETHRSIILWGGFFILFQTVIIFFLVFNITQRRRAKAELLQKAQELTQVNSDLEHANQSLQQEAEHHRYTSTVLLETQKKLTMAVDAARIGIWDYDPVAEEFHLDHNFYSMLGYRPEDSVSWKELFHKEDLPSLIESFHVLYRANDPWQLPECRLLHGDGSVRWVFLQGSWVKQNGITTPRLMGTILDITDRKRWEERSQQAEKMQSIGRLAGGIAHDFNNLLTVISGYSGLVLQTMKENDPLWEAMVGIRSAGEKATALTQQLLAFSRKQDVRPAILEWNTVIRNIEKILHRLLGEDIELVLLLDTDPGHIKMDPNQMEQILINLAVNARDAMPSGGRLTLETSHMIRREGRPDDYLDLKPGNYVLLTVADTGTGMDEETQKRLFEPFYTTKEEGRGTGLGLATVYGIVTQNGGNVGVYSEPGKGSAFHVYLPRTEEALTASMPARTWNLSPSGSETILVVEDQENVRKLTREVLSLGGYKILEAASAEEALEISDRYAEKIHLLLTDVVLPGMSGKELADVLESRRSIIKVLFMSGYSQSVFSRRGIRLEEGGYLQKPFTPELLTGAVRNALDSNNQE